MTTDPTDIEIVEVKSRADLEDLLFNRPGGMPLHVRFAMDAPVRLNIGILCDLRLHSACTIRVLHPNALVVGMVPGVEVIPYAKVVAEQMEVTLEDVLSAALWAERGGGALKGLQRNYNQGVWDCGTACCMWGAAFIVRHGRPADTGPVLAWEQQSHLHMELVDLLEDRATAPIEVIQLLTAPASAVDVEGGA